MRPRRRIHACKKNLPLPSAAEATGDFCLINIMRPDYSAPEAHPYIPYPDRGWPQSRLQTVIRARLKPTLAHPRPDRHSQEWVCGRSFDVDGYSTPE